MSAITQTENLYETATRDLFVVLSVLLPVMGISLAPQKVADLVDRMLDQAELTEVYCIVRGSYREINAFVAKHVVPLVNDMQAGDAA